MTIHAFPSGHNPKTGMYEHGMTLRDYFAAKAMGMIGPFPQTLNEYNKEEFIDYVEKACACCYQIADAMMEARNE